jgi:hypothetical protein
MVTSLLRKALIPLLACASLACFAVPAAAQGPLPPVACPSTFSVLHDDAIGPLPVPAGAYQLTVADPGALSCAVAADRFGQFLEDWDGRLPKPWKVNAGAASFNGGPGVTFTIARVGAAPPSGGGQHPATGLRCPGTFQVLDTDHIGAFILPAGHYTLTLLSAGRLSCAQAAGQFTGFLRDFDGRLPKPWLLDGTTGTFLRGSARVGFRVKAAVAPAPQPAVLPTGRRCPGTFRVMHDDRVGALKLPAGRYTITRGRSGRPSCAASARYLARFLRNPSGRLPSPWKLRPATGTFSRPGASFRVKPAGRAR